MRINNVWEYKEPIKDDILRGIREEMLEEDTISMYDAAFLETYD